MKKRSLELHPRVKQLLFFVVLFMSVGNVMAQLTEKSVRYSDNVIVDFDNTTYCISYLADGQVWAFPNIQVADVDGVDKVVFNPSGSSIALLRGKKNIVIYSFSEKDTKLFELKDKRKDLKERKNLPFVLDGEKGAKLMKVASKGKIVPLAMCYSPDARHFLASNSLGEIIVYDTKEYLPQAYIQGETPALHLTMSSNNYFIAAASAKKLNIWNFQAKTLRKTIEMDGEVRGMDFSQDAALLAVVTDARLTIFDTKTWEPTYVFDPLTYKLPSYQFDLLGYKLTSPTFHPEGKYISVVKDNNDILVINLKSGQVEQVLSDNVNWVSKARFFIDRQKNDVFMLSNRKNSIVFWDANSLSPFYGKVLDERVTTRMNEWIKMGETETMEEYAIRVNDESRLMQQQLFAQEVATELAGDRLSIENPFIGDYDTESGMLNIGFSSMPSISLEVPEDEVENLKNNDNLKFENAVYVLNDKDEFELAYIEVRDETTDKVYIYDNIGRLELLAMEEDDYVPLEIMQQISQEEIQLQEIKEQVVAENKEEELISDNTQIDVKTEVIPSVDAEGKKILNYKVGYQYEVINKTFSASEDFPSGNYVIENSNAAMSLMKIIKHAFEGDFAKYLEAGKQVKVIITGSADASPIRGCITYKGQYGDFVNEPYYKDGNLDNISVTKASGITSNEQLAFMRAAGVKDYIEKNVSTLSNTNNEFEYHVEVAKERGGEYRRINVEFIIVNAFPNK